MTTEEKNALLNHETVRAMSEGREVFWRNPGLRPFIEIRDTLPLTAADIADAEARLVRFAPYIARRFPETAEQAGIIESPLREIPAMREELARRFGESVEGRLFLKQDSELPIAGSVKARGGIYEVLQHSEALALEAGLLREGEGYEVFDSERFRDFFSQYAIHVGSTGNLGLSIGVMSAALGYRAYVHMSADARTWKKALLRKKGVTVIEYASDYSKAVEAGRREAGKDPRSYFVDDENSTALFLGYSVAAGRLAAQLKDLRVPVDRDHPLFVYLPCGVGGAPGGVAFGLKHVFGDDVYCVFAEPVQAPCMLLGLATGLHERVCVQDIGLTGQTAADGLAVGRPSGFVGKTVAPLIAGAYTVADEALFPYLRALWDSEGIFIEPSACAAFRGPRAAQDTVREAFTPAQLRGAAHVIWATGGRLVPEPERRAYREA